MFWSDKKITPLKSIDEESLYMSIIRLLTNSMVIPLWYTIQDGPVNLTKSICSSAVDSVRSVTGASSIHCLYSQSSTWFKWFFKRPLKYAA